MNNSLHNLVTKLAGACFFLLTVSEASAVVLPVCDPGVTCLQFGDFNVYSLALLNLQATGSSTPHPSDPFYVKSTYGDIKDNTIIGINSGSSTETGNPSATTDGAYNTPSANNDTNVTFSTFTAADPAGGPSMYGAGAASGDNHSWDSTVGAIQALIGGPGNPLVAYFGYNETGSGTGLLTTDLLVWARVTLYNYTAADTFTTGPSFYLSGDGSSTIPDLSNLPPTNNATQATVGSWVYVHAGICVDAVNNFVGFPINGDCSYLGGTSSGLQNNLGQNAAAFAINSPGLDAALNSGDYNVMSLDWEMAYINGGGETAWVFPTEVLHPEPTPEPMPEPMSLALLGIGLLGMGISRRIQRH